jgi:hypothetical protein
LFLLCIYQKNHVLCKFARMRFQNVNFQTPDNKTFVLHLFKRCRSSTQASAFEIEFFHSKFQNFTFAFKAIWWFFWCQIACWFQKRACFLCFLRSDLRTFFEDVWKYLDLGVKFDPQTYKTCWFFEYVSDLRPLVVFCNFQLVVSWKYFQLTVLSVG